MFNLANQTSVQNAHFFFWWSTLKSHRSVDALRRCSLLLEDILASLTTATGHHVGKATTSIVHRFPGLDRCVNTHCGDILFLETAISGSKPPSIPKQNSTFPLDNGSLVNKRLYCGIAMCGWTTFMEFQSDRGGCGIQRWHSRQWNTLGGTLILSTFHSTHFSSHWEMIDNNAFDINKPITI